MDTLKVKINVSLAAADWVFVPGEEVELDAELAKTFLEDGRALPIKNEKVDTKKLPDGIEYLGFGRFRVAGDQIVYGKDEAAKAHKEIKEKFSAEELEEMTRPRREREKREAEANADTGGGIPEGGAAGPADGQGAPQD